MSVKRRKMVFANPSYIRQVNKSNVLKTIFVEESISRVELSRITGLRQTTISRIVRELIQGNLLCCDRPGEGDIGRKPMNFRINVSGRLIGIINISRFATSLAVCDLGGTIIKSKEIPTLVGKAEKFFSNVPGL